MGNIAQRISYYHKSGELSGEPFEGRAVKMIHFVNTSDGWKMSSLIWDDERDDFPLENMHV